MLYGIQVGKWLIDLLLEILLFSKLFYGSDVLRILILIIATGSV